jgi:hypothetical protein
MALPIWMLGRNVTSVSAVLQTIAADGTLADSGTGADTAALLTTTGSSTAGPPPTIAHTVGLIDGLELRKTKTTENISAINRNRANHVPVSRRHNLVLTEILRQGAAQSLLANLWFSTTSLTARVVKLTFARAGNKHTLYGLMTDYTERIVRGKNVGRMTIQPVDSGALPTYGTGDR